MAAWTLGINLHLRCTWLAGEAERVRVPSEEGGQRAVAAFSADREELLSQQVRQGGEGLVPLPDTITIYASKYQ